MRIEDRDLLKRNARVQLFAQDAHHEICIGLGPGIPASHTGKGLYDYTNISDAELQILIERYVWVQSLLPNRQRL